jgi:hypothetical protein
MVCQPIQLFYALSTKLYLKKMYGVSACRLSIDKSTEIFYNSILDIEKYVILQVKSPKNLSNEENTYTFVHLTENSAQFCELGLRLRYNKRTTPKRIKLALLGSTAHPI